MTVRSQPLRGASEPTLLRMGELRSEETHPVGAPTAGDMDIRGESLPDDRDKDRLWIPSAA
jgi:hypothetical protein